jgi:hypothetical protein
MAAFGFDEYFGYDGLQRNKITFSANTPAQFGPNNITLIATEEMSTSFDGLAIANGSKLNGYYFAQFDYYYAVGIVDYSETLRIKVTFKTDTGTLLQTDYGDYIYPDRDTGKAFVTGTAPANSAFVQIQIEITNAKANSEWWFTGFLFETPLGDRDVVYSPYPNVERPYFRFGESDAVYPFRVIDATLAPFVDANTSQIGTFTLADLNNYFEGSALDSTDILGF